MSIARKLFLILLGILAIFCCFSLVTMISEKAPKPWYDYVGSYLFMAFLFAICLLTAIACFYLLFTNAWENYEKNYDREFEIKPLNIKIELKRLVKSDALLEDKFANIPCEIFWNSRWSEGKIIRQLKLRTGIGKQFCRIYLVEIGTPPVRQWVSADLIRQPSGERSEPEEYH
ncbi:hypothetical protein [Phormidium nigroviride]